MRIKSALAAGCLAAVLLLSGCARPPAANLLLVTFDTARADRLGCYGFSAARTPALDSLAREGALFSRCFTVAPVTLPAHASLFTGLYPPAHGVRDNGLYRLEDKALTLAEILRSQGFSTAAVIGSYVVTSRFGLAQGFDYYDERLNSRPDLPAVFFIERTAAEVTEAALRWLESRKRKSPFALWLHYYDPHSPYQPPSPFDSLFRDNPYDGEIAFADRELGRFLTRLKETGEYDNTLIIVAGDHGEALGEHGEPTHGIFLYNATVHVPLIVRLPGDSCAGRKIGRNVSLLDVLPTVLSYFGIKIPEGVQGENLLPLIFQPGEGGKAGPDAQRALYLETLLPENTFGWHAAGGLVRGGLKYIESPEPELYDLERDFGERDDLAPADSSAVKREAARYAGLRKKLEREARQQLAGRLSLDSESAERLRALGYISGPSGRPASGETSRPSPRRMILSLGKFMNGVVAEAEGDHPAALAAFDSVLARDPENVYALLYKGYVFMELHEAPLALEQYRRAVQLKPESPANFLLGLACLRLDSLAEAQAWLERTIALNPSHARANALLAEVLMRRGEQDSALYRLEEARRLAPQDKEILNDLGKLLLDRGKTEEAARCFEQALAVDSLYPLALFNLGIADYSLGRLEEAEHCLQTLAARFTRDEKVLNNLGVVLAGRGKVKEAFQAYERATAADSTYAPAYNNLGNLYASDKKYEPAEKNYLRALALDSTYAQACFSLGYLYFQSGESPGPAKKYLERALGLEPGAAWAGEARKALKELGG